MLVNPCLFFRGRVAFCKKTRPCQRHSAAVAAGGTVSPALRLEKFISVVILNFQSLDRCTNVGEEWLSPVGLRFETGRGEEL